MYIVYDNIITSLEINSKERCVRPLLRNYKRLLTKIKDDLNRVIHDFNISQYITVKISIPPPNK